jgi:hypothetical protein
MQTIDFAFSFEDLAITVADMKSISPEETQGLDDFLDVFEEILQEGPSLIQAKGGFVVLDQFECLPAEIRIGGIAFRTGGIIAKQFRQASKLVIFACTAGPGVREQYDAYTAEADYLKAFFVDTLGTVAVEKATDKIHRFIQHHFEKEGLHCTNRYSPGYCGWSVREQHVLWSFLPTGFCGITLTDSALMLPIKSVSGIIGLGPHARKNPYSCSICKLDHCIYRRKKKA